MGVYIKGMELPKDAERVIVIVDTKDGREACTFPKPKEDIVNICEPHGRLIDADRVVSSIPSDEAPFCKYLIAKAVLSVPTVIEGGE